MKVRSGFVSNSSSSSFVIVTTRENYEKCFNKVDKLTQAIVKEIGFEEETVFGRKCVTISSFQDSGGYGYLGKISWDDPQFESSLIEEQFEDDPDFEWVDWWDGFCNLLEENKEETYTFYANDGG